MGESFFQRPEPRSPTPLPPARTAVPSRSSAQTWGLIALVAVPVLVLALAIYLAAVGPSPRPSDPLPAKVAVPMLKRGVVLPTDVEAAAAVLATLEATGSINASGSRKVEARRLALWRSIVAYLSTTCAETPNELVALLMVGQEKMAELNSPPTPLLGVANGLALIVSADQLRATAKSNCTTMVSVWLDRLRRER